MTEPKKKHVTRMNIDTLASHQNTLAKKITKMEKQIKEQAHLVANFDDVVEFSKGLIYEVPCAREEFLDANVTRLINLLLEHEPEFEKYIGTSFSSPLELAGFIDTGGAIEDLRALEEI